ncbi:glyoxalase 3 [[Candida] railenensis]|uniref:D-lactate dehydratase n=1 Tax=[Candida] railenensis TaxID=45579 RepID=A0A9P0W0D8_9ASCO|nr:glyoxalase 3 [[Candida] railenensis]
MVNVLIAITSYNEVFHPTGEKTGLYYTEAIHPFEKLHAAGYNVQFASETGKWGYDEHSIKKESLSAEDYETLTNEQSEFNRTLKNVKKASELDSKDYDIFFAAGGHGTVFDFPTAKDLQSIAADVYAKGGIVAAVCHGPAIFEGLLDKTTGKPLIEGKKVTGFTDEGEKLLNLDGVFASKNLKTVRVVAEESKAIYVSPEGPWDDFTVTDSRIVTGANPQSAASIGAEIVKAFNAL